METADRYPNVETVRWVVDVSRSGDCVVLDDGSKWHVVPSHRMIAGNWPRTQRVRVSGLMNRLYTVSAENDREVQAVYLGFRPIHEEARVDDPAAADRARDAEPGAADGGSRPKHPLEQER